MKSKDELLAKKKCSVWMAQGQDIIMTEDSELYVALIEWGPSPWGSVTYSARPIDPRRPNPSPRLDSAKLGCSSLPLPTRLAPLNPSTDCLL